MSDPRANATPSMYLDHFRELYQGDGTEADQRRGKNVTVQNMRHSAASAEALAAQAESEVATLARKLAAEWNLDCASPVETLRGLKASCSLLDLARSRVRIDLATLPPERRGQDKREQGQREYGERLERIGGELNRGKTELESQLGRAEAIRAGAATEQRLHQRVQQAATRALTGFQLAKGLQPPEVVHATAKRGYIEILDQLARLHDAGIEAVDFPAVTDGELWTSYTDRVVKHLCDYAGQATTLSLGPKPLSAS